MSLTTSKARLPEAVMNKPTHGAEYEKGWSECSKCKCRRRSSELLYPFAKGRDGKTIALEPYCMDQKWCAAQVKP